MFSNMKRISVFSLSSSKLVILPVILSGRVGFISLISWNSFSPSSSFLCFGGTVTSMERRDGWRDGDGSMSVSIFFVNSRIFLSCSRIFSSSSVLFLLISLSCFSSSLPGWMEEHAWMGCLQTLSQSEQFYQC